MYGADADALDRLASEFERSADELDALLREGAGSVALATLGPTLTTLWRGPRAQDFANLWQSSHLVKLRRLQAMLREAAREARGQAAQQRQASQSTDGRAKSGQAPLRRTPTAPSQGFFTTDRMKGLLDGLEAIGFGAQLVPAVLWTKAGRAFPLLKPKDLVDLTTPWTKGKALANVADELKGIKSVGGAIGIMSIGFGLYDTQSKFRQYGWGAAETIESGLDTVATTALIAVPGGGVAWTIGTTIGGKTAEFLDDRFDVYDRTFEFVYGPTDSISIEEAKRIAQRTANPFLYTYDAGRALVSKGVRAWTQIRPPWKLL